MSRPPVRSRFRALLVIAALAACLLWDDWPAAQGRPAHALDFDGVNDYVTFGPAPALGAQSFTLELWFKREGSGVAASTGSGGVSAIPLVSKGRQQADGSNLDANYFLGIRGSDGVLAADFEDAATGGNHPVTGVTPIRLGRWYHAAATYDAASGVWNLYLDGALETTLALGSAFMPRFDSIQHAAIGSALSSTGATEGFFNGHVDEVRIWNVARTQAELRADMQSAITSATGLIGRWGLDEGTGTTAADSAASPGSQGTLTGTGAASPVLPRWVPGTPFDSVRPPHGLDLSVDSTAGNLGNYVSFAAAPALGASSFTLEAWIKREGTGVTATSGGGGLAAAIPLVTKGRNESDGSNLDMNYFMGINGPNGVLAADFEDAATGANHPVTGVTPITSGTWHHVAVTYDVPSRAWSIYLDGILDAAATLPAAFVPRSDSIQHAAIGSALNSLGQPVGYFDGVIDEVRIWNYARSASQLASGMGREITAAAGLLGRWSLDELTQAASTFTVANSVATGPAGTVFEPSFAGPPATTIRRWSLAAPGAPFTGAANTPPVVGAGADAWVVLPDQAVLSGAIVDDAVPAAATSLWTSVSGPGTVTFGDATQPWTSAAFSATGTYVLRLTATDTELVGFDEVRILVSPAGTVNQAPIVDAGFDQTIGIPALATLDGTVTDDALPPPPTLTTAWSVVSGPGAVTFGDPAAVDTVAAFSTEGEYVLRLTATDGEHAASDEVTVTVTAEGASALDFGGAGGYVAFGNPAKLHLPAFTIEAWFRRDGPGTGTTTGTGGIGTTASPTAIPLVTRGRGEAENANVDTNYFLGIDDATDVLAADFEEGATGPSPSLNHPIHGTTPIANGVWYHAAATYDGAKWQLFLNGQLERELVLNVPPAAAGNQHFAIGSALNSSGTPQGFFDGAIDEVRVWNRALTQSEIQGRINQQITSAPSLVGRWGLNQGAGTSVFDSTVDPATGTITGAPVDWAAGAPFNMNLAPAVTSPGAQTNVELDVVSLTVVAADPNVGQTLTYSATGLPAGLSIDAATGEISGTVDGNAASGSPYPVTVIATDDGAPPLSGNAAFTWVVTADNGAPVVDAGADQSITLPANAILDGTVTDDGLPAPSTLTTAWSAISGPGTVTFANATAVDTSASFSIAGSYVLRLTASDGDLTAFDEVTIDVAPVPPVNQPPIVDAGADQAIAVPAFAALDATVTDDGLPAPPAVTVTWSMVSGPGTVAFADANAVDTTSTFTATGSYVLRLTATDGQFVATDDVSVTVDPEGSSALDFAGTNGYVTFGNPAKLHLPAFTIEAWFRRDGPGTGTTTGTGGIGTSASPTAIPLVTRGRGEAENAAVDLNYFLGIDDATDVLAADFEEGAGGSSPSLNHPIRGVTPIVNGIWYHAAATYDGTRWQLFLDGRLERELIVNEPPAAAGNQHAAIGSALTSTGAAQGFFDGAIDEVRIWDRALTMAEIQADVHHEITSAPNLVARWGLNQGTGTAVFDSTADPVSGTIAGTGFAWTSGAPFDPNDAPVVTDPGAQTSTEGDVVSLPIAAVDPDGHTLTYTASNLPPGLAIDPAMGTIAGTVGFMASAGSPYSVMVVATDNGVPVLAGSVLFAWTAANANGAPVVISPGDQLHEAGALIALTISATDPDGDGIAFAAAGLPPGLSINPASGAITGTIDSGATSGSPYPVTVTVSDDAVPSAATLIAFDWVVTPATPNFAIDFDGVNDHVSFASSAALGLSTFTVEAWIMRQGTGAATTTGTGGIANAVPIVTKGTSEVDNDDNRDMNYFLGLSQTTNVLVADFEEGAAGTDPGLNHAILGVTVIPLNVWTHVAATYDGTTWKLYVNGGLDNQLVVGQPVRADSIQPFGIATAFESNGVPEGFFNGLIDEVRVWNHARTQLEIQNDLNRPLLTGAGLVARYGFNEPSGTLVEDSAGAAHGVLQNGAARVAGVPFVVPGTNVPPAVEAGANQSIVFPGAATLDGTVTDDGLPAPPALTTAWTRQSGPGTVTFADAADVDTTATFSVTGTYVLRLTASDGAANAFDDVTVLVSTTPTGTAVDFNGTNAYVMFVPPGAATAMGAAVFTVEAWIKREGAGIGTTTGTGGVADAIPIVTKGTSEVDNADNLDFNYFVGIDNATGVLMADFEEGAAGTTPGLNHPVLGATVIPTNVWTHVAATYDGTTWRLYVNGALDALLHVGQPVRADGAQPFGIGTAFESDLSPEGFFSGVIDEVRIWNVARSALEILNGMPLEIASAPNLLGRWGFNEGAGSAVGDSAGSAFSGTLTGAFAWVAGAPFSGGTNTPPDMPILVEPADLATGVGVPAALGVTASDPDGGPLDVTFYGRRASGTARDFTLVAIPDTQHYVDSANFPIFTAQTQWIVDNRDRLNIAFATHLGDIVENIDAVPIEWQRADASMLVLDSAGVPNNLAPGNHDLNSAGVGTLFDTYFPVSRYLGQPWYAGYLGSDPADPINRQNKNNYELFSVDGLDFIIVHLEYDMPGYAVEWAGRVLDRHPNRRAIISTHLFLSTSGQRPASTLNRPDGTSAEQVWQQLIAPRCNVFLVLNGHYPGEARRTDLNACGQPVHQLVQDYQSLPNGGDGWLRYLVFSPAQNKIFAYTFSPTRNGGLGEFDTDAQSQFVLDYDMQGTSFNPIGTHSVLSGEAAGVTWPNLFEGRTYEWYATVSDGLATTTGPTWTFTTQLPSLPAAPSDLTATAATHASIGLTWVDNSHNEETFVIERSVNGGPFAPLATVSANTIARVDSGLSGSTAYCYRAAAGNVAGLSAFSTQACATTPVAPLSRVFQDGLNGYAGTSDTHIKEGDAANGFGTLPAFGWDASEAGSLPVTGLLRFDGLFGSGPNQVPASARIISATLSYAVFDAGQSATVYESLVNWTDTATFNTFGGEPGVQADEIGAIVGTASGSGTGTQSVDVTASVAAWAATPSANRGWVFQPSGTDGVDVRSSEYTVAAERPMLTIAFERPANAAPTVSAGADQSIALPAAAALDGTVSDDGQPAPVTTTWSTQSGPGTVTFGNVNAVDTPASLSAAGTYVLRLTASDGALTTFDEVTITVAPPLPNILIDSGFESGGSAWQKITNAGRSVVTTPFHGGVRALQNVVSNQFARDVEQTVSVAGNTAYTAGGWVKTQAIAGGGHISLEWRNASNAILRTDVVGTAPLGTVDWTFLSATVTSPVGAATVVFRTWALVEPDNTGTIWYDDLLLTTLPPPNAAPIVSAGSAQTVTFPASASLDGTVSDDGRPLPPGAVTTAWTQQSGPGTVTFGNASAVDTTASFSIDGSYVLRLTADDGELSAFSEVTVTVNPTAPNQPPSVDAGGDLAITLPAAAALDGSVTDDGLPVPPGAVVTTWSMQSGPGTVTFGNAGAVDTTASFSAAGTYVLRLTASDGEFAPFGEVTVLVHAAPSNLLSDAGFEAGGASWLNITHTGRSVVTTQFHGGTRSAQFVVSNRFRREVEQVLAVTPTTSYTASGWVKTQAIAAGGDIVLEWRTAANTVIRTDVVGPLPLGTADWTLRSTTVASPATAASVVFRLQAFVEPDNAGTVWFDDLVLTNVPPPNGAPVVSAGSAQAITFPALAPLDGTVVDDGLPIPPGALTTTWTVQSGPGTVTFGNPNEVDTSASFSIDGTYVLRLTADDGTLSAFSEVTITVNPAAPNQPPSVDAGSAQTITMPAAAALDGTVSDDGLPIVPGTVVTTWSMQSGPGAVTFADALAVDTSAAFSTAGVYVLRLTADDGELSAFAEVTITVNPAPPNLLSDGGFEAGGAGWQNITHSGRSVVTTPFHSGARAVQMVVSNKYAREVEQQLAVSGSTTYTASGWMKTQNIAVGGNIVLLWRDAANAVIRTDVVGAAPVGTVDWTLRTTAVVSPPNAASVIVRPQAFVEPDNAGTIWFDDVMFAVGP